MPELPEVETVIRSLLPIVVGKRFVDVEIVKKSLIKEPSPDDFREALIQQKINNIVRKGKYIFFLLDEYVLISHLRMTGKYFFNLPSYFNQFNLGLVFKFEDDSKMYFSDARNFATFHLQRIEDYKEKYPYKSIGIDLLNEEVTSDYLYNAFKRKASPIKSVLLEQSVISGIGNIYASEVLFIVSVHPLIPANSLTREKLAEIIEVSKKMFVRSVELGGSSISDFVNPLKQAGNFQKELNVYGRKGQDCLRCLRQKIELLNIDARSTFFCANCQKLST